MSTHDWIEATPEKPCPCCGHDRRCTAARDGNAVCCRYLTVPPTGWRLGKQHRGGGATFHREGSQRPRRSAPRPKSEAAKPTPPPTEITHQIYDGLLSYLGLSLRDHDRLKRRGLSEEQIQVGGYKSLPASEQRREVTAKLREQFGAVVDRTPGFGLDDDGAPRFLAAMDFSSRLAALPGGSSH